MPVVLRVKGYRFFFFSNESKESIHIHVESNNNYSKFWLNPVCLSRNIGFKSYELKEIRNIINENHKLLEVKWNEFFAS